MSERILRYTGIVTLCTVTIRDTRCVSVSLYLMKGPHDDELTWGKVEVKLLNQISDCEHCIYIKCVF